MTTGQKPPEIFAFNIKAFHYRYPQYTDKLPQTVTSFQVNHQVLFSSLKKESISNVLNLNHLRAIISIHLDKVMQSYIHMAGNTQQGLIVIEPSWKHLADFFSSIDCRELILSPYIHWIVGENWQKELCNLIQKQGLYLLPPSGFGFMPTGEESQKLFHLAKENLTKGIRTHLIQFNQNCEKYFNISTRSFANTPPRIWAHIEPKAPIYSLMTRAMLKGFTEMGVHVRLSNFNKEWCSKERVISELIHFSPDAVFFLNGPSSSRFTYLGMDTNFSQRLPARRLTWYVDHPRFLTTFSDSRQDYMHDDIAVVDKTYRREFQQFSPHSLFHLLPSAMLNRRGQQLTDYSYSIVYVGSIIDLRDYLKFLTSGAYDYLQSIIQKKIKHKTIPFSQLIDEARPSDRILKELQEKANYFNSTQMNKQFANPQLGLDYFFYVVTTFYSRWDNLSKLLPLGLHIFGPDNWLSLLGEKYKSRHHGLIGPDQLPDCYASSRINLNFHSVQCPTSLNIRDFDIPRSGGFLLTDWVEDTEEGLLQDNKHFCVFHPQNLLEKVDYYLHNPDEARHIAEKGCEWVAAHHTPRHRARTILENLFPEFMDKE